MEVWVSGRNMVVSDRLRAVAEEKIGRLGRFIGGIEKAEIHFIEERNPRIADKEICEVTLEGRGHHVRCKVRGIDGFQAVDRAVDTLEHQLHKLKTKLKRYDKHAKAGHRVVVDATGADPDEQVATELGYRVVRTKELALPSLTPTEAALQMDLVDHPFYFFTESGTGRPAVVYRREDGDIGVLLALNGSEAT